MQCKTTTKTEDEFDGNSIPQSQSRGGQQTSVIRLAVLRRSGARGLGEGKTHDLLRCWESHPRTQRCLCFEAHQLNYPRGCAGTFSKKRECSVGGGGPKNRHQSRHWNYVSRLHLLFPFGPTRRLHLWTLNRETEAASA